jgi:hypothetical protein
MVVLIAYPKPNNGLKWSRTVGFGPFRQKNGALRASGCAAEPATVNQYDARAQTWRRGIVGARREAQAPPAPRR